MHRAAGISANLDANTFPLVNVNSNRCLTIAGGSTDLNVTAAQFPCDGDTSRNWRLSRWLPGRARQYFR